MDENPDISVTIACISVVGGAALLNCVRSVLHSALPCMVVVDCNSISDEMVEFASARRLEMIFADGCTVPDKRVLAIARASTDWVALVEDTCTLDAEWRRGCEEIIRCGRASVGSGPVALGQSLSISARALYCSDYGKFIRSALRTSAERNGTRMSPSESLPGVNLLYRRDAVRQFLTRDGLIESEVHRRMSKAGHRMYFHEELAVTLEHADANGATLRSRFIHGRLYAGLRSRSMSAGHRTLRAGACALLPFVLSWRSLRALAHAPADVAATAAHILAFETAWSCGECVGYLVGGGRSLEQWQ